MALSWSTKALPGSVAVVRAVSVGGGVICVVDSSHKSHASIDGGDSWVTGTIPGTSEVRSALAHDGTRFCAVGAFPASCAVSLDGVAWTAGTMPAGEWRTVVHNGSFFCAVSSDGRAAKSTNGTTWTNTTTGLNNTFGLAWNGTVFCAVSTLTSSSAVSTDGAAWTLHPTGLGVGLRAVAWNGATFCAVETNPSTSVYVSPTGVTWTPYSVLLSEARNLVAAANDVFVTDDATAGAYASDNGVDQPWISSPTPLLADWQFGAVGSDLIVLASGSAAQISVAGTVTTPPGAFWTNRVKTQEVI